MATTATPTDTGIEQVREKGGGEADRGEDTKQQKKPNCHRRTMTNLRPQHTTRTQINSQVHLSDHSVFSCLTRSGEKWH